MRKFGWLLMGAALAAAPATAQVKIQGAVKQEITVSAATLAQQVQETRWVKWHDPSGGYLGALEVSGTPLRNLLDQADIQKKTDDGFPRPLDVYLVCTGRDGRRAVFSWGELFYGDRGTALLVDRLRLMIPHHHADVGGIGWDPERWLDEKARATVDWSRCAGCHDGKGQLTLRLPRGLALVPALDRDGSRFIEDLVTIEVRQIGIQAPPKPKEKQDRFVAEPRLVLGPGKEKTLSPKTLAGFPRREWADTSFGAGRGFHGQHRWAGFDLGALLKKELGTSIQPAAGLVLITAPDGYRSLFSFGEIFLASQGENVLLVDTDSGKPLSREDGRWRSLVKADFFIDRSVRLIQEIRIVPVP